MGITCSADQSAPLGAQVSPCPKHRSNPQRDCRACQEFMRSRRPEPRTNQYPQRVQQRYPPQMRGQGRPQQPPMGHPPQQPRMGHLAQGPQRPPMGHPPQQPRMGHLAQERYMTNNQTALHPMGNFSEQMTGRQPREMMGGQPAHIMAAQPAHILGGQPAHILGGQPPQIMGQPQLGTSFQGVVDSLPSAQPPIIIQDSGVHIPQQVMPPRVINQEVPMPTVIQSPAPPPCSTDVISREMEYQEILPAQKVVYEQVVMPVPKAITAPAPPPCSTDILVQDLNYAQQPQPRRIPQQPAHNPIQPQNYKPRFL